MQRKILPSRILQKETKYYSFEKFYPHFLAKNFSMYYDTNIVHKHRR